MDEDEKEMLSEARARLANTRGKKAKRKAREAQLDEARRLASLQKKRELKAAGIYASRLGATRRGGKFMDYDKEVPFQKLAPAGFYDVGPEKAASAAKRAGRADADFEAIRLDKFEEQRRDEAERIAQRDDRKKRAKLMKQNLPAAVAQLSRLNDPASKLRRSELSLPAPQVTDSELEDVARLTADEQTGGSALLLGSSDSGAQRIATAARDARTPLQSKADDPIAQEARNAALERTLQTPLLGQNLCRNQISRRFSPSTRRLLDGVVHPTHWLISTQGSIRPTASRGRATSGRRRPARRRARRLSRWRRPRPRCCTVLIYQTTPPRRR